MLGSALLRVLKMCLGPRWPVWFVGIIVFVSWPAMVFHSLVDFSPVRFTEHWIKTSTNLFLLYFLVESLALIRVHREDSDHIGTVLRHQIIAPLRLIETNLELAPKLANVTSVKRKGVEMKAAWVQALERWPRLAKEHSTHIEFSRDIKLAFESLDRQVVEPLLDRASSLQHLSVLSEEDCERAREAIGEQRRALELIAAAGLKIKL